MVRRRAPWQTYRYTLPPAANMGGAHAVTFVDQFLRAAVEHDGAPPASRLDALRVLELIDAIYRSDETGQVVHLSPSGQRATELPNGRTSARVRPAAD